MEDLDEDARMIVHAVRYKMLRRQKDDLEAADKKDEEAAEKEAAYAATTTHWVWRFRIIFAWTSGLIFFMNMHVKT